MDWPARLGLSLGTLGLLATSGPAKNPLQLYRTEVGRGEVRLYPGQTPVRRYPVPAGSRALTLLLPGKLVIAGDDRRENFFLQIFDLERNRLLREQRGVGNVHQLYSRANTLFMKMSSSGAGISSFTLARSLTSKSSATVSGWLAAEGVNSLLFDGTDATYDPYEPVVLHSFRFDLTGHRIIPLTFRVPARPGCGPAQRDTRKGENDTFTFRRIIATRHDSCGVFQASFDWTTNASRQPVLTPVQGE